MIVLGAVHYVASEERCELARVDDHGVETADLTVEKDVGTLFREIAQGGDGSPWRYVEGVRHGFAPGCFHWPGECPHRGKMRP